MTAALVLGAIGLVAGVLLSVARRTLAAKEDANADAVVVAIDALLPQSQCAQCGYPGCRPYAEAVAAGERLDLCPPGGPRTVVALSDLLGRTADAQGLAEPGDQVVRIVEKDCIGCALCIDVCPVDAITGAPKYLHAVIAERCTGCELCMPACPVDCIELVVRTPVESDVVAKAASKRSGALACIGCGWCEPACPVDLKPQALHDAFETGSADAAVFDCIECTACTRACPSGIDLLGEFRALKGRLRHEGESGQRADAARRHSDARTERLTRQLREQEARRAERLRAPHQWQ